jgi:hypothetical protein
VAESKELYGWHMDGISLYIFGMTRSRRFGYSAVYGYHRVCGCDDDLSGCYLCLLLSVWQVKFAPRNN